MNSPKDIVKNKVSKEMAVEMLARLYGFQALSVRQMVSFDDTNFHIKISEKHHNPHITKLCSDGYTFKVANSWKTKVEGYLDSMHGIMRHLDRKDLRAPQPVMNLQGQTWSLEEIPFIQRDTESFATTRPCFIHLLTYIPGEPICSIEYSPKILWQWGNLLAQFQNAMEDYTDTVMEKKTIFWNLSNVYRIKEFLGCVPHEKTILVQHVLDQFSEEIQPIISTLPKGSIHGDFNENNILVIECNEGDTCSYKVEGILDFEDTHCGTYVWDVGMMLAYVTLNCEAMDPLEGMGHALAGYLQLRSLSEKEMSLLKICIASRLCQSLVLGAYSYTLEPENSYLIVSSKTGWSRLELVWNTTNEELQGKFKSVYAEFYEQKRE